MSFRENLLYLRAESNMTQEQLAELLGVSRQSVAKWEADKSYPEMDKLLKLCDVFDCTLDELVTGDLANRAASEKADCETESEAASDSAPETSSCADSQSASEGVSDPATPPEDTFGYDAFMRRFARRISLGIFAVVPTVGIAIPFLDATDPGDASVLALPQNVALTLGLLILFIGVGACLALIVPAGMSHSAFVRAHPYIEDFYTTEDKSKARTTFAYCLIGGIACIFAGICIVTLLSGTAAELLAVTLLLICIGAGAALIVWASLMLGRTNIAEYNANSAEFMEVPDIKAAKVSEERKKEMLRTKKTDQKIGAICGTIMMIATIVALLLLFGSISTGNTDSPALAFFWLPWPFGGILCGITSLVIKGFSNEA